MQDHPGPQAGEGRAVLHTGLGRRSRATLPPSDLCLGGAGQARAPESQGSRRSPSNRREPGHGDLRESRMRDASRSRATWDHGDDAFPGPAARQAACGSALSPAAPLPAPRLARRAWEGPSFRARPARAMVISAGHRTSDTLAWIASGPLAAVHGRDDRNHGLALGRVLVVATEEPGRMRSVLGGGHGVARVTEGAASGVRRSPLADLECRRAACATRNARAGRYRVAVGYARVT